MAANLALINFLVHKLPSQGWSDHSTWSDSTCWSSSKITLNYPDSPHQIAQSTMDFFVCSLIWAHWYTCDPVFSDTQAASRCTWSWSQQQPLGDTSRAQLFCWLTNDRSRKKRSPAQHSIVLFFSHLPEIYHPSHHIISDFAERCVCDLIHNLLGD